MGKFEETYLMLQLDDETININDARKGSEIKKTLLEIIDNWFKSS